VEGLIFHLCALKVAFHPSEVDHHDPVNDPQTQPDRNADQHCDVPCCGGKVVHCSPAELELGFAALVALNFACRVTVQTEGVLDGLEPTEKKVIEGNS